MRIPTTDRATVRVGRRTAELTNLGKTFWPEAGYTKRDLLQYYADVSAALLPHLRDRPMVMKRYPNGIHGKCFFMKRTPPGASRVAARPARSMHKSANLIDFPMVQDLASLLWVVNLGLHRPQPVVRPLRRHRPPRLPPLRSRPRRRRAVRAGARDRARRARRAGGAGHDARSSRPAARAGCTSTCRSSAGPLQKDGVAVRQGAGPAARAAASEADHRRVPRSPSGRAVACWWTTTRTRGAARSRRSTRFGRPRGHRLDAGHVAGGRARRRDRGLPHRTTCPARVRRRGDLWKPLLAAARTVPPGGRAVSLPLRFPYAPDGGRDAPRRCRAAASGSTSPSGTASAASPSATATRCGSRARPASRSGRYFPDVVESLRGARRQALRARRRDRHPGGRPALVRRAAPARPSRPPAECGRWSRRTRRASWCSTCWWTSAGRSLVD